MRSTSRHEYPHSFGVGKPMVPPRTPSFSRFAGATISLGKSAVLQSEGHGLVPGKYSGVAIASVDKAAYSSLGMRSTSRHEYPHSLSYQPITFTCLPCAIVERPSMMHELGLPTTSDDTIGSSVYWRIPSQCFDAAASLKTALMSSAVAAFSRLTTRSVTEPSGTGTRIAMPSSLPLSSGTTSPIARAAPVEAGTMFSAAERMRRRSGFPLRVIDT